LSNTEALARQLGRYNGLATLRQVTVEFVQTSQNPVTQDTLKLLGDELAPYGLDLSKFVFTIVPNPGIP